MSICDEVYTVGWVQGVRWQYKMISISLITIWKSICSKMDLTRIMTSRRHGSNEDDAQTKECATKPNKLWAISHHMVLNAKARFRMNFYLHRNNIGYHHPNQHKYIHIALLGRKRENHEWVLIPWKFDRMHRELCNSEKNPQTHATFSLTYMK